MSPGEVETLERATVAAVAPPEVIEIGGWIVPFDNGTIGRAKSAAPLSHDLSDDDVGAVVAAYRARGLSPAFRIPDLPAFDRIKARLADHDLAPDQPTVMKVGDVTRLADFSAGPARVLERPDAAWAEVFVGEGFDPADGAHRVAALSRSPGALYGAAGENGATLAVGVASFGHGWSGIHGMRTHPQHRGRGYAPAILAQLGREMRSRGVTRVFLQVEEGNPARRIYRRAGFSPAWTYRYWR